jgi:hypothetical protein
MKKTFVILGIIALVAAIGFSLAACKQDDEDFNQPKQFIKVEGIPSTYNNNKYGIVILSPPNSTEVTIYSALEKINGTSKSFPLYMKNDPWEGSGSYCVKILIFANAADEERIYEGVTAETNITGNTVIQWSSFIKK